jgi:SAM-dependent methyltransferase
MTLLLGKVQRRARRVWRRLTGREVVCNICGWRGERFTSDSWHPYTVCPHCRSEVRHRLLTAAFQHLPEFSLDRLCAGRRVLHFAPEVSVAEQLRRRAAVYHTADYEANRYPNQDFVLDMSAMPSIGDAAYDLVLACDVLEHVPADRAAMRELWRVLSPGGYAILTVPQKDNLAQSLEDPRVVTPEARLEHFGQQDHVRMYGADFTDRLQGAGFTVTPVDEHSFSARLARRHVLYPPVKSPHPLATNYRKVYFARK